MDEKSREMFLNAIFDIYEERIDNARDNLYTVVTTGRKASEVPGRIEQLKR